MRAATVAVASSPATEFGLAGLVGAASAVLSPHRFGLVGIFGPRIDAVCDLQRI